MKGKHRIIIQNRSLHYEFDIRRNITIIQGDSGTGKSTLIDMLRAYDNLGDSSGISLSCDVPCRVLEGRDWETILRNNPGVIFFTDEENSFIHTEEFARAIRDTDNYYVLITRENLYELPISVEEIYGIHNAGRYHNTERVYQQFYRIYSEEEVLPVRPEKLIVEDSNAGYDFFHSLGMERSIECISSGGNAQIYGMIDPSETKEVCIIADGAAFGAQMNRVYKRIRSLKNYHLYLPESFEWIILMSGLIDGNEVKARLEKPEEYADSLDYFSWEQFFTDVLISYTEDDYLKYRKNKLNEVYLHSANREKILRVIKGLDFGSD